MSSTFTGKLLGMGNPLLDISANVGQDLLDKYNVKLDAAILAEEQHQALYPELVQNYNVQYIAGGATQNSCRVAQWMLGSDKGQVSFMGCIGANDDYGKQLEACATADGVCVHYMKDETTSTGTCAALILGGERALVANLAAANNFKASHLETSKAQELIHSAQVYYSAGFFLTVSVESMEIVAQHAVEHDKIYCLNLSAPFIIDFFANQLATMLEYADYLFANESEAATYGKKHGIVDKDDDNPDLTKIAMTIAALPKKGRPGRTVIFTQGSKSTLVVTSNGKVTEYPVEELSKEKLVDTNGAGDAFVGGFLSQLIHGKDMDTCIKAGHWAARYIIQTSGTTLDGPCEYTA